MFRTMAAVAASAVVVVTPALPAVAASTEPTVIDGFASSSSKVDYKQPVTFSGALLTGRTKAAVPGEPVEIDFKRAGERAYVPVAKGTTGADGRFSIATTLPSGGYAIAVFGGDTGLAPSRSNPTYGIALSPARHLPTRFVASPVAASTPAGTSVTFSGTLQVQVDGAWQRYEGAPLTLTMRPDSSTRPDVRYAATTGADGSFSLTEPITESGDWSVATALDGTYLENWFQSSVRVDFGRIAAVSKTRVASFGVPSHDEAHHAYYKGMYATGTVERWNGTSWDGVVYGTVDLYHRREGSKTWHNDGSLQTDAYGNFKVMTPVHLGTADWRVRVRLSDDTNESTSAVVRATVTDQTRFATADAYRGSRETTINGQVTDWYDGQVSFSSLSGLKLRLYYRARGSKTWHSYRTTTVGHSGIFQFTVAKGRGYYFKVVLPAQGPFQSSTSRTL